MVKTLSRTLALGVVLTAMLALASCGGPVAQSHDLLDIGASPQPLLERALVVCPEPGLRPAQLHDLAGAISARAGVTAWQYDPHVTIARMRSDMGNGTQPLMLANEAPFAGSPPRAFIVVAKDPQTQMDLVIWLSNRRGVRSVVYWLNGGGTEVVQGPLPW